MICVEIPGFTNLAVRHLVMPVCGCLLTSEGTEQGGVAPRLAALARDVTIHLLYEAPTDWTGSIVRCHLWNMVMLPVNDRTGAKLRYVERIGVDHTVAIGVTRSDQAMLRVAAAVDRIKSVTAATVNVSTRRGSVKNLGVRRQGT